LNNKWSLLNGKLSEIRDFHVFNLEKKKLRIAKFLDKKED